MTPHSVRYLSPNSVSLQGKPRMALGLPHWQAYISGVHTGAARCARGRESACTHAKLRATNLDAGLRA